MQLSELLRYRRELEADLKAKIQACDVLLGRVKRPEPKPVARHVDIVPLVRTALDQLPETFTVKKLTEQVASLIPERKINPRHVVRCTWRLERAGIVRTVKRCPRTLQKAGIAVPA